MIAYRYLLNHILRTGEPSQDRTGVGTRYVIGQTAQFDLSDGLPLLALKYTPFKTMLAELLWFLKGTPDPAFMHAHQCTIWNPWIKPDGTLGPVYGVQWRSWPTPQGPVDQLQKAIDRLRQSPYDRRAVVSAWNVSDLDEMALPPCHLMFQLHIEHERVTMQVYQRSADVFIGVPFNWASYATLCYMIAGVLKRQPGRLIWHGGNVHLYNNHVELAWELLRRPDRRFPQLKVTPKETLDDYTFSDFTLENYIPHPPMAAPVAV